MTSHNQRLLAISMSGFQRITEVGRGLQRADHPFWQDWWPIPSLSVEPITSKHFRGLSFAQHRRTVHCWKPFISPCGLDSMDSRPVLRNLQHAKDYHFEQQAYFVIITEIIAYFTKIDKTQFVIAFKLLASAAKRPWGGFQEKAPKQARAKWPDSSHGSCSKSTSLLGCR